MCKVLLNLYKIQCTQDTCSTVQHESFIVITYKKTCLGFSLEALPTPDFRSSNSCREEPYVELPLYVLYFATKWVHVVVATQSHSLVDCMQRTRNLRETIQWSFLNCQLLRDKIRAVQGSWLVSLWKHDTVRELSAIFKDEKLQVSNRLLYYCDLREDEVRPCDPID